MRLRSGATRRIVSDCPIAQEQGCGLAESTYSWAIHLCIYIERTL